MGIREVFHQIEEALVSSCLRVYGERLEAVVVFGSVARGRPSPDSDLDVLVVAEPLPDGRLARMDEFDQVERELLPRLREARQEGVWAYISPLVVTPDELPHLGFVLFDIATEGVVRYDRAGRVEKVLAEVREGLARRGAERRYLRGSRYWVLEPGVRPGQVVRLW
jgi:predicted nucleotidyltransferase